MSHAVTIIGIRHHSPACARLVREKIHQLKPAYVLIEGPSDYNPRRSELLLAHQLPIALYSYAQTEHGTAQCWFPFLDYSPEWVAFREAAAMGAETRWIDLPHWHYRALPEAARKVAQRAERDRFTRITRALCRSLHVDSSDTLWDHLFECAPANELEARLSHYFALARGETLDDDAQDSAREAFMARYIAWAAARVQPGQVVLVVCGGWHKPALEALWPSLEQAQEPDQPERQGVPLETASAVSEPLQGSYLMPFEFRQVDALGGYQAGMQSPLFYQWLWQYGPEAAVQRAMHSVLHRLRLAKVTLSTAELIQWQYAVQQLAALRAHAVPTRADVLDALQSVALKEAMEVPAPWSEAQLLHSAIHPVLREALMALTGSGAGELHSETPEPPLVKHVNGLQRSFDLKPELAARELLLDRRQPAQAERAMILWRFRIVGLSCVQLKSLAAPKASRNLPEVLNFEEHWQLCKTSRDYPELIEASAFGATLELAAASKLHMRLRPIDEAQTVALAVQVQVLNDALRAGFWELGESLAQALANSLQREHDHGALAAACNVLLDLTQIGFWGQDVQALFVRPLREMLARLLWLLDGISTSSPRQMQGDVDAVQALARALKLQRGSDIELQTLEFVSASLLRFAQRASTPPALRGACVGASFEAGEMSASALIEQTRAMPPRDALGDYLYGLFALARSRTREEPGVSEAIHAALDAMGHEDFLVALPPLRAAFAWFPPRERGQLAQHVAQLLGLQASVAPQLTRRIDLDQTLLAKRVEARVMEWRQQFGLAKETHP